MILEQGLEPGSRLPSERELAARLGVSRPIVSQALRSLSLMGLVEIKRGSGAFVTRNPETMVTTSVDLLLRSYGGDLKELATARYWLEQLAATHAIDESHDARDLRKIEDALERMETSSESISAWANEHSLFHATVVEMAGNRFVTSIYESIHTALLSVNYEPWVRHDLVPAWLEGDSFRAQVDMHGRILEALKAKDHQAMDQALFEHHQDILKRLEEGHDA
jgi:GntR family transcriptional repressor for pyruvate dehydrogenase complex